MKTVYENEAKCCGCGACASNCPVNAIRMSEDKYGFIYPKVDTNLCIDCGLCKKRCAFSAKKRSARNLITHCYAAINKNTKEILGSSSGGIFSAIAHSFIDHGGVVCGAVMTIKDGRADVMHRVIKKHEDVEMLQGSKYVQSNLFGCLEEIEQYLLKGQKVLFSGTPCQVDAIRNMFKKYVESNLFTIDIICHGVPSQKMFNDYLTEMSKRGSAINSFKFRDKKYGWGLDGRVVCGDEERVINPSNSSYYKFFLDGDIYRVNCYECPYACLDRVGDITIGDYWGVEKYNKELLSENGGQFVKKNGVSCVLVNNVCGEKLMEEYGRMIAKKDIDINNVIIINRQLVEPAKLRKKREVLLNMYLNKGYNSLEKQFKKEVSLRELKKVVKELLPTSLVNAIKNVLNNH